MARRKQSGPGRDNNLRPTSGKELREAREVGYVKRLWSGLTVRIKTPDLLDLVAQGQIPDTLTPLVTSMLFRGIDRKTGEQLDRYEREADSLTPEELTAWRETLRVVCVASFVEPKIVDSPQADDEISILDVPPADQVLVWQFAVGGANFLKSFRTESFFNVESVSDRQDEPLPAQPDDSGGDAE